jgi:ZU5 domain
MSIRSFGIALMLASCSSSPKTTSNMITPSGGTVQMSDGTAVNIPAGALTQTTQITVGNEPNSVSITDEVLVGSVYRFGPEGTQFATPVTVTLDYDPSKLPTGDTSTDIVIMTAAVGSSDFQPMTTTIVDDTHVSTTTTHFSDFVAAAHKKNKGSDMSVVSVMDSGTTTDAAGSNVDQASSNVDMTPSPDMANGTCPHMYNIMNCTLSENIATNCGGGALKVNCQQSICICQGGSGGTCTKPSPPPNMGGCPSQAEMESLWGSCCMFP